MEATYLEQDCVFTHEGRSYESGGAVVTPDFAIGYTKFSRDETLVNGRRYAPMNGTPVEILNWHGDQVLGSGWIVRSWRRFSYLSTFQYQIQACINGVWYTGRTSGNWMIWKGFYSKTLNK